MRSQHTAPAVRPLDVQLLQTAASLENLAVISYGTAAHLAAVNGNRALAAFVRRARAQHAQHADAFNAAVRRAGGPPQHAADPRYAVPVGRALSGQHDAVAVLSVLASLEDSKAQSYTRYTSLTSSPALRKLFVSTAVVEAQHRAYLLAALQLLDHGPAELLGRPALVGELPETIGASCCPHAFYQTAGASAIDEGAVK
jgi:ferritin-like protein